MFEFLKNMYKFAADGGAGSGGEGNDANNNGNNNDNTQGNGNVDDHQNNGYNNQNNNKQNDTKPSGMTKEELLKELGFDDEDSATEAAKKFKEEKEKNMTDVQKENKKFLEEKKMRLEAEKKATEAEAKVMALMEGAKPECVEDVIALATARVAKEKGMELKDAVNEIKKSYANMFVQKEEDSNKGKKNTGGVYRQNNGSSAKDDEPGSFGKRLAEANSKSNKKSSFFSN